MTSWVRVRFLMGFCLVCASFSVGTARADITFSFSSTVRSFIDNDNVYGFGVNANLSGDSVTDVYTIDPSTLTFSTGTLLCCTGSVYNEYIGALTGTDLATSTINGHTITIGPSNGDQLSALVQQTYAPNPYNQTILGLQAIGLETTGTEIGTEFLIRDEVVSYSTTVLPLSLSSGYTLSSEAAVGYQGVYFPYARGATAGFFGTAVPEPASWTAMLIYFGVLGLVMRGRRQKQRVARA